MKPSESSNVVPLRLTLSGQDIGTLIKALVDKDASVKLRVTGKSMYPSISSGDILSVVPCQDRKPAIGDIVCLSAPDTRQIVIHRIIKVINGCYLIKGDNILRSDGVFDPCHILGYVRHIERNKKIKNIGRFNKRINVFLSKIRFFSLYNLLFSSIHGILSHIYWKTVFLLTINQGEY